jgi:nitrate/nitrite transporter NarK
MQIPVGYALDRVGPRLTTAVLLGVAALGAGTFAMAAGPGAVTVAMALIGIGCSSVLMASYFIFARLYTPAVFGTLAGMVIGIGSIGNIAASLPLSWAVEAIGWRGTLWALAAITALTAVAIYALVRDPARVAGGAKGSLLDLLMMPALWPILLMMAACYAPPAGLRGLWAGPWRADVFGEGAAAIGQITLIMGLSMVAGNFAYGPMERLLGSRKWLIVGGNTAMVGCLLGLYASAASPGWAPVALLAGVGFFGASFPMVMAHGRAFLPPHLVGRGVTLINLFGIGAVGLMQIATGWVHASVTTSPPQTPYETLFLFYAALTTVGLIVYLMSQDRTD